MVLPNWAAVVLVFGAVIFVHELGHFLLAKAARIRVHEFALGFGPSLLGWRRGGTRYSLRLLPFGGFVRMAGMEPGDLEDPDGYNRKSLPARASVIAAGPAMNVFLAGLLLAAQVSVTGVPGDPIVGRVEPGSPAEQAGLVSGDRIVRVNGREVRRWAELVGLVRQSPGAALELEVLRQGRLLRLVAVPASVEGHGRLGVEAAYQPVGPLRALAMGYQRTFQLMGSFVEGLRRMVAGDVQPDFAGPVGISQVIADANRAGLAQLLYVAAFLNINVALLNLLPIPALDGSRLLFLGVEAVRGAPLDPRRENLVHLIGFLALLLLTFAITYNELIGLFHAGAPG